MLTDYQRDRFASTGIVKFNSLLSEAATRRAQDAIKSRFKALGLSRDGDWTIESKPRLPWPDKGYKAKAIGNKVKEIERLLDEPGIKQTAKEILDCDEFSDDIFKRPQILVTFPNKGQWFIPCDGWHVDIPRLATGTRAGVQAFFLLSRINPQGGATLNVSGSHLLLNDSGFVRSRDVVKTLKTTPFFSHLMSKDHASIDQFHELEGSGGSNEDTDLRVVELTGSPGDVYFMDMRVIHSASPNMSDDPRVMATHRFLRSDANIEMP